MSNVSSSKQAGRYQTRQRVVDPTLRTLSSLSTGGFFPHPVTQRKIEILGYGFTPDSDSGSVTTSPVIAMEKLRAADNGTWAEVAATSFRLTALTASQQGPTSNFKSLDQATEDDAGLLGVQNYPTAVRGDLLRFNLITQGAGGTQTGYVWYEFRECPDADVSSEEE